MTTIIVIIIAIGLVMVSEMVLIQYFLVKLRKEFKQQMQSQTGKYDCILTILAELMRTQNDSRILLANMEGHLRSITGNDRKERHYSPTDVQRTSV